MKPLRILVLLVVTVFSCINLTQAQTKLDKKTSTIIVSYGHVACTCAQWVIYTIPKKPIRNTFTWNLQTVN
jgi:monoamine oxidase